MGEISKIASRIGIIDQGKLIKELTVEELNHRILKAVLIKTNDNERAITHLKNANYNVALGENNEIEIKDENAISHPEYIADLIVGHGLSLQQLYVYTEDLEKFFLRTIRA